MHFSKWTATAASYSELLRPTEGQIRVVHVFCVFVTYFVALLTILLYSRKFWSEKKIELSLLTNSEPTQPYRLCFFKDKFQCFRTFCGLFVYGASSMIIFTEINWWKEQTMESFISEKRNDIYDFLYHKQNLLRKKVDYLGHQPSNFTRWFRVNSLLQNSFHNNYKTFDLLWWRQPTFFHIDSRVLYIMESQFIILYTFLHRIQLHITHAWQNSKVF